MRIHALKTLKDFWKLYTDSEKSLRYWYGKIEEGRYDNPQQLISEFKDADYIGNERIVFNICKNKFRLIVAFNYEFQIGFVKFLGTHKMYDEIDSKNINYKKEAMELKLIKSEKEYEIALGEMEKVLHAKKGTASGERLEILSLLINKYEQTNFHIEPLSALEALQIEMQQQGMNQQSLAEKLGMSKSAISEILNGKKQMTVKFLKFLHKEFGIPAHFLLN